jgi:hypothetical protein
MTSVSPGFAEDMLRRGVRLAFPGRENTLLQRLRGGEQAVAQGDVVVETAAELYLEEGELAEEPTFETTDEEQAAGFP